MNPLQAELDKPLAKSLKEGVAVGATLAGPGKFFRAGKLFKRGESAKKSAKPLTANEKKMVKRLKEKRAEERGVRQPNLRKATTKKAVIKLSPEREKRLLKATVTDRTPPGFGPGPPAASKFKNPSKSARSGTGGKTAESRAAAKKKGKAAADKRFKAIQAEGKARKRTGSQPRGTFGPDPSKPSRKPGKFVLSDREKRILKRADETGSPPPPLPKKLKKLREKARVIRKKAGRSGGTRLKNGSTFK